MRTSSALKKDLSGRKLSTASTSPETKAPVPGFDKERLVSELLSLGNDKIKPELAKQIGEEVEAELQKRSSPKISPELISEIVQFKLQERGLIEIRRRRPKHTITPEEEMTVSLTEEELGIPPQAPEPAAAPLENSLAAKVSATRLPTLEKFLRPRTEEASASFLPLPPKATVKVARPALNRLEEVFAADSTEAQARLESLFGEISTFAAALEPVKDSAQDSETLAIEFFNLMANQEFYPHLPILFQCLEGAAASMRRWGPVSLSWRTDAALPENFFEEATRL
ncbi:MAG: hypothetical protein K8R69_09120, partial [Deltaproteobacteria bacterium]|nr:hypothetical protein [Deltaproteobacteria bacterium]